MAMVRGHGRAGPSLPGIPKPKWVRRRTYDRKLEEIFAAEEIVDAYMQDFDRKLDRLLGR